MLHNCFSRSISVLKGVPIGEACMVIDGTIACFENRQIWRKVCSKPVDNPLRSTKKLTGSKGDALRILRKDPSKLLSISDGFKCWPVSETNISTRTNSSSASWRTASSNEHDSKHKVDAATNTYSSFPTHVIHHRTLESPIPYFRFYQSECLCNLIGLLQG